MMHGREKSDSAIVAAKPPNGAGVPAEEGVERRAGAEGNAGQDHTHRAQDRESVSQGLDRVRHVARTRKKERFTALLHHVDVERLRAAYSALKRDAAPGVDGITWYEYGQDLERRLVDLHGRVHRAHSGRSRADGGTFQSRTAESARSASQRWRTRSSSARW